MYNYADIQISMNYGNGRDCIFPVNVHEQRSYIDPVNSDNHQLRVKSLQKHFVEMKKYIMKSTAKTLKTFSLQWALRHRLTTYIHTDARSTVSMDG